VAEQKSETRKVLLHLSDEKLRHRNTIYSQFDLVIRNYFDPRLSWRRNVVFFPLGWTSEYGQERAAQAKHSDFLWSFIGATKGERRLMVDAFLRLQPSFTHFSSGWNSVDQVAPARVRDIQEISIFALCPPGNAHLDTFRVMEALEAGAIPVVTKFLGRDYFRYTFGNHPFVVARNWQEAAERVTNILANSATLALKKKEVTAWYQSYRARLFSDFEGLIFANESVRRNDLYRIQRSARFDLDLQYRIWRKFRRFRK